MGNSATTVARAVLLAIPLFVAGSSRAAPQPAIKPYLAAALADPERGDVKDIDTRRKPGAVLAFSGVKPGDKVVDLIPGPGYFTRIFSKVVGPTGHVYMIWPNEYAKEAQPDPETDRKLAQTPGFQNISVIEQPGAAFAVPEPVDLVFTAQNYHDYPDKFMGRIDPLVFDRAVYRALKPGGVFLIVDHVAQAGSGMRDTDTLHRIDPAIVRKQVESVGFRFVGESDVLRNPVDDHTRTVFDKAIRGHTDQFIFKFRKPG
jgi:predicted methyltransferase